MNRILLFLGQFLGLRSRDYQLAMLLDVYADEDPGCWPSVETLQRELRVRSRRTVQLALARLRKVGAITDVPDDNPTGRFILLNWRQGPGAQSDAPPRTDAPPIAPYVPGPSGEPPIAPDRQGETTIRNVSCATPEETQHPETDGPTQERSPAAADPRPDAAPTRPLKDTLVALPARLDAAPEKATVAKAAGPTRERSPAVAVARPVEAPVRPLKDALEALPGEAESVESLAWRLARHFNNDIHSISFYRKVLGQVARREPGFPVERLLDAFRVADRARSSMGKPGGLFAKTWRDWNPPVRRSQINAPTYHRAERPVAVTPEAHAAQGLSSSEPSPSPEELAQARAWASLPSNNPMRRFGELLLRRGEASAAGS